ncbi:MAG: hypothetical protein AAF907_00105, partial [Planctomycetota bacterium]
TPPPSLSTPADRPLLQAWNKTDLTNVQPTPNGWLPISVETGAGLKELLSALSQRLISHPPPPGVPIPLNQRHAELIASN